MENTKADIPDGERIEPDETELDLPELPGDWSWGTSNHYHWNHKVNVYFGLNSSETGGHLGEIDNYIKDGEEWWTVHVRPIISVPDGNRPRAETETADDYPSLNEAIAAVPDHIATYYE